MRNHSKRPFFHHSITQLEALFQSSQNCSQLLKQLADELQHRDTLRATKLREEVAAALNTMKNPKFSPPPIITPHPAAPSQATPPAKDWGLDEPSSILAAWTALEALTPQTYRRPEDFASGDRACVADLPSTDLPWRRGERSHPKRRLFYHVVLGCIHMGRATEDLIRAFGEDEERPSRIQEKSAIAAVMIDQNGVVVEDKAVAVSSFAWALPLALQGKLGELGQWPSIEGRAVEELTKLVDRVDDKGKRLSLDWANILAAHNWLATRFGLPHHLIEKPSFAIRVYHYFKAKTPPEPALLNSFFLNDLSRVSAGLAAGTLPAGLRAYLGMAAPASTFDLLENTAALEQAVSPALTPAARWPVPGGFPLVLLQQAAVNLARTELRQGGIVAVNGPPGTGKTTLLRDLVAGCVLDRALAMATFEDPEAAFTPSGEKVAVGDKAFFHLYRLDERLKGHEILVASSNNKAVENVSKELPATKAMGRVDYSGYFKLISDVVLNTDRADEDGTPVDPTDTWGLIAAVLGNARNRAAFQKAFWWHEDFAFRLYLKAAKGDPVVREIKDPASGEILERRPPAVVETEAPPTAGQAKANWRRARDRMARLHQEIQAELTSLEEVRRRCLTLDKLRRALAEGRSQLDLMREQADRHETYLERVQVELQAARDAWGPLSNQLFQLRACRPGLLARLFRTKSWREWMARLAPIAQAEKTASDRLKRCEGPVTDAQRSLADWNSRVRTLEDQLTAQQEQADTLSRAVDEDRGRLGNRLVDADFFAQSHTDWNLASPWLPDDLHRKREDLFLAALDVHRAFIDVAAQKVLHNLSILMDTFAVGPPPELVKKGLLGELWSTLFLVVPVLSTTFASVERMLGALPPQSLGWLLVDEAGQALPQAATGAILRAKRTIVVGDPLQIPPVVTLPDRLNAQICSYFNVTRKLWAAPDASCQTLADRTSRFQGSFRSDQGPRQVGMPLLVHRRCQEPMFGIANRIAYDGQMVHAAKPDDGNSIGNILGPSRWFDLDGTADSKWCAAEGEVVVDLLRRLADGGVVDPELFIITPFRSVAQEMRRRLDRERSLFAHLRITPGDWTANHVGTIHTVQGREADAVMLVLGAPMAAQNGARAWATGTPNILNVAVSRAKKNFYVIGSYGAWSGMGHARELGHPTVMPRERLQAASAKPGID
ncbi:DEAD/DEAH box helicase [Magnetospirillum fulvum]|uniref:AAA domain-containing protein n=1 Tax=Magnetospirillum fulvum TaxID=1082 RepID=A0A1H6K315_MAGFU|nr:AAA domain-containing protein [Magnetospirillum fulvum]SEH67319.1 AAA domain-containing protein [Magnetospirillum fulvum]